MTAIRDAALLNLQRATFQYFLKEVNPLNGLVRDSTREGAPSSITAVGLGLATYVVGAERGFIPRNEAVQRTLTTLRFFWNSPQGKERDATGYKGFYYHFFGYANRPPYLAVGTLNHRYDVPASRDARGGRLFRPKEPSGA